jgi:hypothetical protein
MYLCVRMESSSLLVCPLSLLSPWKSFTSHHLQGFKKTSVPPTGNQKNHTETRCRCDAHVSVKLGMIKGTTLLQ